MRPARRGQYIQKKHMKGLSIDPIKGEERGQAQQEHGNNDERNKIENEVAPGHQAAAN
jgi:hypothetical protein